MREGLVLHSIVTEAYTSIVFRLCGFPSLTDIEDVTVDPRLEYVTFPDARLP